jgi:hypothetical protein
LYNTQNEFYINNNNYKGDKSIMNKNIKLGLITIGKGDWKKVITDIWDSLKIEENEYTMQRAIDNYNYKLKMPNEQLPSYMTNYDLHLKDEYIFNLTISMPVIDDYEDNDKMVLLPWWEEEMSYREGSKMCSEKIVKREWCDNIIILCGDNLSKEELDYRNMIAELCVENGKTFLEIGNDCECMSFRYIIKWLESGENYSSYRSKNINRSIRLK